MWISGPVKLILPEVTDSPHHGYDCATRYGDRYERRLRYALWCLFQIFIERIFGKLLHLRIEIGVYPETLPPHICFGEFVPQLFEDVAYVIWIFLKWINTMTKDELGLKRFLFLVGCDVAVFHHLVENFVLARNGCATIVQSAKFRRRLHQSG